jgi:MFS family permease
MQPVWGMLSDRLGRVRVMRLALLGVVVPGFLSALVLNLAALVVGRALAGGLFAAVIPAALVYIGDAVPISSRQKALADQLAASARATAIATAAAGLASHLGLWRLAFAAPVPSTVRFSQDHAMTPTSAYISSPLVRRALVCASSRQGKPLGS